MVVNGSESHRDVPTIADWARVIAVSYSGIRDTCDMLEIPAHKARNLVRAIRAVRLARLHNSRPEVFLNMHDARTLKTFLVDGGLAAWAARPLTVDEFLERQQFIPTDHPALRVLRRLLT
jgi:hypothetical protein